MKKRQFVILGIAFLIFAGSIAISQILAGQKEPPKKAVPVEAKRYVKTEPVEYSEIKTEVEAYGRVETAQALDLVSEVAGRMYQGNVRLKEGTSFQKGTLLFYVDDTEATLNLKSQKSNFVRDLAAILPDLKLDFSEKYNKWESFYSNVDIEKPLPALPKQISDKEKTFLATKGIFTSYYSIKSAEVRLEKHKYFAPFAGSVMEVNQESGAFINPGVKIGRIIRKGAHELRVSVDTKDIPWIQENTLATVISDETQQTWDAIVTRISDFVNQNTQSVDVFLAIQSNGVRIYDGQFLKASIPARTIKDGMIIPRNAIYNGNEVFVLEDSLLKKTEINVHRVSENQAIFSGLDKGKLLVVEPLINAHNNMKALPLEKESDFNLENKGSRDAKVVATTSSSNAGVN